MEKIGAKHSAETRAHHEALDDCMTKIAQACGEAQDHVHALLGKGEADGAARPAFAKQESRTRTGEQTMNEQQTKELEKAATDSALAIAKVAELTQSVAGLRAEIKSDLEDLGQALANLTAAIGKLHGDSTQKAARAVVPLITITKEEDGNRTGKGDEDGKSVHELLKQTLQNPQRASHYLR